MASGHLSRTVLVAHHTPDLYGSDRQLLESVAAMTEGGLRVVVTVPHDGPLVPLLRARGAEVVLFDAPVVRRSSLSARGLVALTWHVVRALGPAVRLLRSVGADAVFVNTLILPFWLLVARLARRPALCHVHEAPDSGPRLLRAALVAPLLLARVVVTNSTYAARNLATVSKSVAGRAVRVPNGVAGPPTAPREPSRRSGEPAHLVLLGRLSRNKGVDVALAALTVLVEDGRDVRLSVLGTSFPGYEAFEDEVRAAAQEAPLRGRVRFAGYVSPVWDELAAADVVLNPSRIESFGNAAVEAMLAMRPVVGTRVQGLPEVVADGETGLLVPTEDAAALAAAVASLLDDPTRAANLARAGRERAETEFAPEKYRVTLLDQILRLFG